jgi:hypothetical protein
MDQRERGAAAIEPATPLLPPFPVLLVGLGAIAVAWLLAAVLPGAVLLRAVSLALGVIAVGTALALHLPHAGADVESRLGSAGMWLAAVVTTVVARLALDPAWDSIALLFRVMTLVCVLAAVLTALPAGWRMLAISLLIVFHFAGILIAITLPPPINGTTPWVSAQLWTRIYRPYLTLTNLNNGYHFYSPEPGPCALLWFRVEFADGASCWVRVPKHDECRNHLERRRYGALATSIGQSEPIPPGALQPLIARRLEAGNTHKPPIPPGDSFLPAQYREPGLQGKMLLASYARYVARKTKHPAEGAAAVTGVKIYYVEYHNPPVEHFQAGRDPLDPTLYAAYYMGEYDVRGELKPECFRVRRDDKGQVVERVQDPFLYWLIPIVRVPSEQAGHSTSEDIPGMLPGAPRSDKQMPGAWAGEGRIINYVRIHAGDKDEESIP